MTRLELITEIERRLADDDLTIHRNARFKKMPLRAALFYTKVALNRYSPLLIPITAETVWGHTLKAYETSAIGSMHFLGFYDSDITLFLLKNFHESGDLLDIGANVGVYTSLFSYLASDKARVVAFEPTPSTYGVLKENTASLTNVTCEQIALSDHEGQLTFFDYGLRHGVYNSAKEQPLKFLENQAIELKVETMTLDTYCEKNKLAPSLVKLDTEGTEETILTHADTTLSSYHPTILLEVGGGEAWSENVRHCFDILAKHGYGLFTADKFGNATPHKRKVQYSYQNIIAIHESKLNDYAIQN